MNPTAGSVGKKSGPARAKALVNSIVTKLGTALYSPEAYVMTQDDDYDDKTAKMFFLGKGKCFVNVRDESGHEHEAIKALNEGDHFGEIAMIYKCKRTASVICSNYNTMAILQYKNYRELVAEYPEYEDSLKDYIRTNYNDPKTTFLLNMVQRVEYLAGVSKEILFDIIFSLVPH
jgi:CRP-like cAMP-binding protein